MKPPSQREPVGLASILPMTKTTVAGKAFITMSEGQAWDSVLQAAFDESFIVLVLDRRERPLRAFRKPGADLPRGN